MQPSFIVCCLLHWFKTKHMQTLGILKGSLWKVRKVSCNRLGSIDPATVTRLNGKQAPEPRWEWGATTTEFCSDSQDLLSRCRSQSVKMPMFSQTMQRFFFGIVWEDWYVYFCIDDLNGLRKQLIRLLYVMHCMYHTLLAICMILYSCPHIWIYIDALWKDAHEEFSTTRLPAWLQGAVELLREDWTTGWGLRSWLCGQAWVAVKELRQLGARGKERQSRT